MKKLNRWLATAVFSVVMISSHVIAQTPLNEFFTRAQANQLNTQVLTLPIGGAPPSVQTFMGDPATNIQIDTLALFDLPDFQIELPGLENFYAVKEKLQNNSLNGMNWIGDVVYLDPTGLKSGVQGRAYFVEHNGLITGAIHTADEVIQIYPDGAGGQVMVSSDPAIFDNEGEIETGEGAPQAGPAIGGRIDGESPATMASPYVIDVMYVVTADADAQVADMPALIELALTTGNDVLVNSQIPTRLRLVETHYTNFQENGDMSDDLSALRNPNDGLMDDVHTVRTQVGADMVMMVSSSSNYCGIAYLDASPEWTFSVTYRGCMSSYTPIHEFGHNFGAHHDDANASNYSYPFGYGLYNNIETPYWRTVMSYQCPGGGCNRIPYFTTPALTYNNLPLGDPETLDNARVIRIRSAEIASYYTSVVPYCTEHTSTNDQHLSAGRAYTQSSGGFFPTTTYYAVGSDDNLGTYGFLSRTLAEDPAGYFSLNACGPGGEAPFAPEVQNLTTTPITGGLRLSGEIFDANNDEISHIEAKVSADTTWATGSITGNTFDIDIPSPISNEVTLDIQTADITGASFSFSTTLALDLGEAPTIALNGAEVFDQDIQIYGNSNDPDNAVPTIYYQVDGNGDPASGIWIAFPVTNNYWTLDIPDASIGNHTIHVYGVDETDLQSNVLSVDVTVNPLEAPLCEFAGVVPATNGTAGEVELLGLVEDVNQSDVSLEYRIDGGTWSAIAEFARLNYRQSWALNPSLSLTDGATHSFDVRAIDSSNLQTNCGTIVHTVAYPTGEEAPSCEFTDIFKYQNGLRYYMVTSDPNGNQQQMFAKESSNSEWLQTWPAVLAGGEIPIPGIGEFTIQGRVVDSSGLEGFCEQTVTLEDQAYTPEITSASGYYEAEQSSVLINIWVEDWDGDLVSVELREQGSSTWLQASQIRVGSQWNYSPGDLANGIYHYEARATDSGGRVSDIFQFNFENVRSNPPTLSNVSFSQNGSNVTITGNADDENGNLARLYFQLDDNDVFYVNASPQWSQTFTNLSNGAHSVHVYARDTNGLTSETETVSFTVEPGLAPTLDSLSVLVNANTVTVGINASDADGDISQAAIQLDGGTTTFYPGTGTWDISYSDLTVGNHQIQVYIMDSAGNNSPTEIRNFNIASTENCYTASNNDHLTANRALTRNVGETCFGTICFGGTITYFAIGSDDNMGTSASAETTLKETTENYYEIGTCPIVDTTPPVLSLLGDNPMDLSIGETFNDPGATATDDVDGDITANITISGSADTSTVGSYTLTYNVSDAAGNIATPLIRTINVTPDDTAPVITLNGDVVMDVTIDSVFIDPGAIATDNVDGDISASIQVTGTVDTSTSGTYMVYYDVSDAAGNAAAQVTRTVNVVEGAACVESTLTEHVTTGRAYEQYYSYYATGTGTYLGSTFNDAEKVISMEEVSAGNWSEVSNCS
ncbi:MAG: DUF5011 domain-containing protein [Agarilytica sp.]